MCGAHAGNGHKAGPCGEPGALIFISRDLDSLIDNAHACVRVCISACVWMLRGSVLLFCSYL